MNDNPQKISIFEDDGWWLVDRTPCKEDNDPRYYAESVPQALADALADMLEFFHGYQNMEMRNWREALAAWEKLKDD